MTSTLLNALETLLPAVLTLLYAALIGLGVQAAVAGYVRFPRSLGITAGIGLSLTALLMVYSYRLFENPTLPIVPLAAIAIVAIAARFHIERSKRRSGIPALPPRTLRGTVLPGYQEIFPAVLAVLVLAPALKYGLTTWTTGGYDFPNYASSAEVWMTSRSVFSEKYLDSFGAGHLGRSNFEKPIVTSILVLISKLSSYPPYRLLTPLLAVLLFIGFSTLFVLIRRVLKVGHLPSALAISLPTFSIVPISRIYDAQPGQVAAIAFLACTLAILAAPASRRGARGLTIYAAIVATVGAATIGTNFTLVAGSSIMLGAAFVWALSRRSTLFIKKIKLSVLGGILAIILSIPMADMYYISFTLQTAGEQGSDIALASPLSVIGQQISLISVPPGKQVLFSWCIAIAAAIAALWARSSGRLRLFFDLLFVAAAVANALLIGLRLGWNNYATHKWLALFIAFAGPLLIAYWASILRGRGKIAFTLLMMPLSISSVYIGLHHGSNITYVISQDLINLRTSEELASQSLINVRLGDPRENSIAALVMPARSVAVIESTYNLPAFPREGMTLIRKDQYNMSAIPQAIDLNNTYSIIPTFLPMKENTVTFSSRDPESRLYLFGVWHVSEQWGTWSGGKDNYVIFELPDAYREQDIVMNVTGMAYTPNGTPQTVEVVVNDELLATLEYPLDNNDKFDLRIPRDVANAKDGRMTVNFRVANPYSPSQFGSRDVRALSFGLSQLKISPGG